MAQTQLFTPGNSPKLEGFSKLFKKEAKIRSVVPQFNELFIRRAWKWFHSSSGDICFKMKMQNEHIS